MNSTLNKFTDWEITEETSDPKVIKQNETLFSLSNGHIGTRGSIEEAGMTPTYSHSQGTYMNGFFETNPIIYGEWAYGYAKEHQTIIPLPDGKKMNILLDDEPFNLEAKKIINHKRKLNLKEGILYRSFNWKNQQNNQINVNIERFVSFDYPEIIAQRIEITPQQSNSSLRLVAVLDTLENISRILDKNEILDPRKKDQIKKSFESTIISNDQIKLLSLLTNNSNLRTIVGSVSKFNLGNGIYKSKDLTEEWTVETTKDKKIILERFVGYSSFFQGEEHIDKYSNKLNDTLSIINEMGYESLKKQHLNTMNNFWAKSDIQIEGDDKLQIGLRFNIFHLNQAAGRDGKTNISAKGITGEGYEGHYFWDTEMYMLPFFIYTQPDTAKKLLEYRHSILPNSRKRARELAIEKGALFPWRTINGEEASAYYPAGTAQFHINSDIAHGVYTYIKATGDQKFSYTKGLEILIETARFWTAYGHYDPRRNNAFVIDGVTGPDEYTAIVNNNFYTNLMAKHNLKYAIEIAREALKKNLSETNNMLNNINFNIDEIKVWEKAANAMFLPYDEETKLTMQDDSFFHLEVWNLDATPKDKYPLLLNYHPLTIYRHQVNKQPDTVLAQFMFSWEFDMEQKKRDYEYYEKISTHDSSLSRSIYSMMASEIDESEKAYNYFMDTALMDLTDMQSNTKDGVHAANMGGSWMSLVYGFSGMRLYDESLHFSPKLPKQWKKLVFKISYQDSLIEVMVTHAQTTYKLLYGPSLLIYHNDLEILVK